MRLRFLGAPHVSKSPHLVVDSAVRHKPGLDESVEAKTASLSTTATDASSVRQLRQRRVGDGLWAIRRHKMEKAAQLRPRIVVHMSRLRGRKTAADFGAVNSLKKRRLHHSAPASGAHHAVIAGDTTLPESRSGANIDADSGMDTTNGFKVEQPEANGDGDDINNSLMIEKENDGKPSGDAVNLRPKRQIMQKKLVSLSASLKS